MEKELFSWLFTLIEQLSLFGSWLTTPLEYINLSPLALFSFAGLTIIIGFLIVRLVIGG